ncbi:MAG: tetratricopeptide repeat protein, partial [Pseudobdellovibrionaceae bacterium]
MQRAFCFVTIMISLLISIGCSSIANRNSEKADLHMRVAVSHMNNGDYPTALRELLEAEKYSSSSPVIQHNLGMTYFLLERPDLAEPRLKKAVNLNSRYTDARVDLARVLTDRELYKEAKEHLKIALVDLTYENPGKT